MRECQPGCTHFFDSWHIASSIGKPMIKLAKEKGCEKIGDWVKGVRNHLYWCVTSTKQGFQEMIAAKWQSFMQHVANKHDDHPTPMFKKCAHEEIGSRRWIKIGREQVYLYLHTPVTKTEFSISQNSIASHWTLFPVHSSRLSPPQTYALLVFLLWLHLEHSYIALIKGFTDWWQQKGFRSYLIKEYVFF